MDVKLGVVVDGNEARIALIDDQTPHAVIDESRIDLTDEPFDTLVSTLVATDRQLTEGGHRLVGTSVCSSDADTATRLANALTDADLMNVSEVSQSDAVTAVTQALVGSQTTASLISAGDTAALSIIDADAAATSLIAVEPVTNGDHAAAYRTLLERFSEEPGGATSVIVFGAPLDDAVTAALTETSPVPLEFPDNPEFALARGVALVSHQQPLSAAPAYGAAPAYSAAPLDSADTMMRPQEPQLAYSEVEDSGSFPVASGDVPMQTPMHPLSAIDPEEFDAEDAAPEGRPRVLLLGSTVAAVVVVGFAALAVSVAINIRPTVSEQAVRLDDSVAGKYFPVAPNQGTTPSGPAWTVVEQLPEEGTDSVARVFQAKSLIPSANTGGEVIKSYADGTYAVEPAAGVVGSVVENAAGAANPVGGAMEAPEYLTRLIPDFSKFTPCQVMGLVSNMSYLAQVGATTAASTVTGSPLSTLLGATGVSSIDDLGVVTLVDKNTGPLFDTTQNVVSKAGGTVTDAIPTEIFEVSPAELNTSSLLPPTAKVITAAPETGVGAATEGNKSLLGKVFTSQNGELTEVPTSVTGTGKSATGSLQTPEVLTTIDPSTSLAPEKSSTKVSIPGSELGEQLLPIQSDTPVKVPDTSDNPIVKVPDTSDNPIVKVPDTSDKPIVKVPDTSDNPIVKVPDIPDNPIVKVPEPITVPDPPAKVDPPVQQNPIPQITDILPPARQNPVPEPVIEAPAPVIIEQPAPVIDVPVQAPSRPIIDIPIFKPSQPSAPIISDPAPAVEAPSGPSLPIVPELPIIGGLFGSGN